MGLSTGTLCRQLLSGEVKDFIGRLSGTWVFQMQMRIYRVGVYQHTMLDKVCGAEISVNQQA